MLQYASYAPGTPDVFLAILLNSAERQSIGDRRRIRFHDLLTPWPGVQIRDANVTKGFRHLQTLQCVEIICFLQGKSPAERKRFKAQFSRTLAAVFCCSDS